MRGGEVRASVAGPPSLAPVCAGAFAVCAATVLAWAHNRQASSGSSSGCAGCTVTGSHAASRGSSQHNNHSSQPPTAPRNSPSRAGSRSRRMSGANAHGTARASRPTSPRTSSDCRRTSQKSSSVPRAQARRNSPAWRSSLNSTCKAGSPPASRPPRYRQRCSTEPCGTVISTGRLRRPRRFAARSAGTAPARPACGGASLLATPLFGGALGLAKGAAPAGSPTGGA